MKQWSRENTPIRVFTGLLCAATLYTLLPFAGPIVLAAWLADLSRPLSRKISRLFHWGGNAAAAAVTSLLVLGILLPVAGAIASLTTSAISLGRSLLESQSTRQALVKIVSGDSGGGRELPSFNLEMAIQFLRENGERAWGLVTSVLGATAEGFVGVLVVLVTLYVFLSDGDRLRAWLEERSPLDADVFRRFVSAFSETGRGLFTGVVLTGFLQSVIATVAYVALGVPRAVVLGFLTFLGSFVPSVGTALVWVPVTIGLVLAGRTGAAIAMAVVGVGVIGVVDNVFRPVFARFGNLQMSGILLLFVMLGGAAAFGGWGLVFGPLFARLALEGVEILYENEKRVSLIPENDPLPK